MSITYVLAVDFDEDGSFVTAGDDITAHQRGPTKTVLTRGRSRVGDLRQPVAGSAETRLDNRTNVYDPGTSLTTDLPIQFTGDPGAGAVVLWQGYTQKITQAPDNFYPTVGVRASGPFAQLIGRKVSTALYQGITTDVAIGHVLDAASFPAGARSLETGQTTLDWFWADNEDAFAVLKKLVATEGPGAELIEGIDGTVTFYNRHHKFVTAASTAVQSTIRGVTTEPVMSDFSYDDGRERAVGSVLIPHNHRSAAALGVIWTQGSVSVGPSQSATFIVRDTSRNPFTGLLDPVAGTDYTVVSGAVSSATFDRLSGGSAMLTITATAAGCSLSGLQARAQLVTLDSETLMTSSITPTNPDAGSFTVPVIAEIPHEAAQDLADGYMEWFKDGPAEVTYTLHNRSAASETEITARAIADRVRVIETATSIDINVHVEAIQHRYGGQLHSTTYTAEKVPAFTVFILDTSTLDGADVLWI